MTLVSGVFLAVGQVSGVQKVLDLLLCLDVLPSAIVLQVKSLDLDVVPVIRLQIIPIRVIKKEIGRLYDIPLPVVIIVIITAERLGNRGDQSCQILIGHSRLLAQQVELLLDLVLEILVHTVCCGSYMGVSTRASI